MARRYHTQDENDNGPCDRPYGKTVHYTHQESAVLAAKQPNTLNNDAEFVNKTRTSIAEEGTKGVHKEGTSANYQRICYRLTKIK